jgi:hypothetical protein
MQRVDFFIAGVQKGGTTALDDMLRGHPAIQMARRKEVHFFDNEEMNWRDPDYTRLHDQFDWAAANVVRGEATPIYTYWPNALERIARYNPAARMIVGLRHPALRAHSHWRMEAKRLADPMPFSEAIRSGRQRMGGGAHRVYSYVERGFYAAQVQRVLSLFERALFIRTDNLWTNPRSELSRVCEFLEIPTIAPPERNYVVPVDTTDMARIGEGDYDYLTQLYADDIVETSRLTGLDLSDWLRAAYQEGIRPLALQP